MPATRASLRRAAAAMTAHRLIAPREFRRVPWKNGGGHAAEIAAWPVGSPDDFAWRVAIAEIERDGPFSSYPGVDRTFVLLDGDGVVLVHDDIEVTLTVPHEPYRFSGDSACMCRLVGGRTRAYNLMVRRDRARGTLVVSDGAAAVPGPFRFGVCYAAPDIGSVHAIGTIYYVTADGVSHTGSFDLGSKGGHAEFPVSNPSATYCT